MLPATSPSLLPISHMQFQSSHWDTIIDQMTDRELEITFLGTGAALPSKYRNVSAIFLNLFEKGGIMLDCGEGTLGQLYRVYGDATNDILRNLKIIWISHLHADHHLGIVKLLKIRRKFSPNFKIIIIGPEVLNKYLREFSACCGDEYDYEFVLISNLLEKNHEKYFKQTFDRMNVDMKVVTVDHSCKNSYGVIVTVGKIPIVYSGDTRPCKNLTDIKECAILIHEATFEDELADEAVKKKHATTGEAIKVGSEMGAWRILLTHFSQRYPKIPILEGEFGNRTMIAFDLMRINIKHICNLPSYLPPLRQLFAEELQQLQKERGNEE